MKWLFNPCRRCEADLSLLAAGVLAEAECAAVKAHLDGCPACRARFAELKAIAGRFSQVGGRLPQVEAPASLRRRWMTGIREAESPEARPESAALPAWLSNRRLAWGGVAAMWTLIVFFRLSAPEASRPAVLTAAPASWREVLLALEVGQRDALPRAGNGRHPQSKPSSPAAEPPRTRGSDLPSTANSKTA